MIKNTTLAFAALLLTSLAARAVDAPPKPADAKPDFVISEMRIQRFPGLTFFYTDVETTLAKINDVAAQTLEALDKAAAEGNVRATGPVIFIYPNLTAAPDTPFKVSIGMMVADGTKPAGQFKVKKLADFRCATVIYSGPMSHVADAFQKVFGSLMVAAQTPTGEIREYYLYWETPDSPNNVVQIQVGIK